MGTNGMINRTSRDSIPHPSKNNPRNHEFVAVQNSAYVYTDSRKSATIGKVSAPTNTNPFGATFTEGALETILNGKFANCHDQDDRISDEVAKNIEDGIADINSRCPYTPDERV